MVQIRIAYIKVKTMKYTLIFILLLISLNLFAQETTIISVTLEARDCEIIGGFTSGDFYQDLDSSLKSKFRPAANAPSGTTNVTLGGVTAGVWLDVDKRLRRDAACLVGNNNPYTRVETALRNTANAWLIAAMDADITFWDNNDGYSDRRARGRARLKRQ